jgi:epoxyqueuosine reductase
VKLTNEIVEEKARELGFDLVGFAKAEILNDEADHLEDWLKRNFLAGMSYMERNIDKRKDIRNIFPEAKSVISLGLNYYTPFLHSEKKELKNENLAGKISRYAWGKDYHLVIWDKLKILEKELNEIDPEFKSLSYVDTGPVMDKAWAVRSGIGWMGKHTNVINQNIGSWFFIANIISNYDFNYSEIITDHCGSCTACLEACPTNAITEAYVVDSNKCISYLTIENKDEIPEPFKHSFDDWIFGCDICQDVCPWNIKFSENCEVEEFNPVEVKTSIDLFEVLKMDDETFNNRFKESPVKRAKLSGLKRNASFLLK